MKICVAQIKPVKGDLASNINNHRTLIDLAINNGVDAIIFPELSLTGYEPSLARESAIFEDDIRLRIFQNISDKHDIVIGVGVPLKKKKGISINTMLFQPEKSVDFYSKMYLHPDEEAFFVRGQNCADVKIGTSRIAFGICYECSVSKHVERVSKSESDIYVVSAVKFKKDVDKAISTLSEIAKNNAMIALLSNSVGEADGHQCGGKSSLIDTNGLILQQLDNTGQGLIILDTNTHQSIKITL